MNKVNKDMFTLTELSNGHLVNLNCILSVALVDTNSYASEYEIRIKRSPALGDSYLFFKSESFAKKILKEIKDNVKINKRRI